MKKILVPVVFCAALAVAQTVNFPFPQNPTGSGNPYGRGIIATNFSTTTLKNHFLSYLQNFYEESGNRARIRFDTPQHTVSEGIGYGMLMMVYFSDRTTSYEPHFQKLWAYYNSFLNQNGLMHWKINGFTSVDQQNAATDGELDVALALIMGYYQFGNRQYMDDALALIAKIRAHEVDNQDLLKPGDAWNERKNPSYFGSAAIELFRRLETNHAARWANVLTVNYAMVRANAHATTGLVSDWCNPDGSVNGSDIFSYDAARTPWRLAKDYLWFNRTEAKTINDRMASWIRSSTSENPANIRAGYNRSSGTQLQAFGNGTFSGAFSTALVTNTANQSYLNATWTSMMGRNDEGYFNESLKILAGLVISGNMPNLAAAVATSSSSTGGNSSSSAVGTSGLIDNLEDGNYASNWGGEWYTYNDNADLGASTVTPLTSTTAKFTPTASPGNGSSYAARIQFTLNQGQFEHNPFVGLGLNMRADEGNHSLESCTEIRYRYRGAAHRFRVESASVTNFNYHGAVVPASTTWATQILSWADILQEDWGATAPVATLDRTRVKAFSWQVQSATVTTGELVVDDVQCVGGTAPPAGLSSSAVVSSSSVRSSSSVLSSSSVRSSSSVLSSSSVRSSSSVLSSSSVRSSSSTVNSSASTSTAGVSGFTIWGTFVDAIGSTVNPVPGQSPVILENGVSVAQVAMTVLPEPAWDPVNPPASSAYPFVGMIMEFNANSAVANLSAVTSITLRYRSTGTIRMSLNQVGIPEGQEWGVTLVPAASYTTVTIPISQLAQPTWVSTATNLRMAQTTGVKWELKESAGASGSISIQSISFTGYTPPQTTGLQHRSIAGAFNMQLQGKQVLFTLENPGLVRLEVLDMFGRLVATPVNGWQAAGNHTTMLGSMPAGLYILRLRQGNEIAVDRINIRN